MDPQQTVAFLDELERLGSTNDAFSRLHHFREMTSGSETISGHRSYCQQTASFQNDGNNDRVSRRLDLILTVYKQYHAGKPAVFPRLAEAAYVMIPPVL